MARSRVQNCQTRGEVVQFRSCPPSDLQSRNCSMVRRGQPSLTPQTPPRGPRSSLRLEHHTLHLPQHDGHGPRFQPGCGGMNKQGKRPWTRWKLEAGIRLACWLDGRPTAATLHGIEMPSRAPWSSSLALGSRESTSRPRMSSCGAESNYRTSPEAHCTSFN